MIDLITGAELAERLRFQGQTGAFREFCKKTGIQPVPGRKDCYDPVAVREKLNQAQGIAQSTASASANLLEISKERRHAA